MIRGRVTGRIWSSKHIESMPNGGLLEIQTEDGAKLIAFDPLGCADGEEVLITQGSVAADYFTKIGKSSENKSRTPIDALIIGSVDQEN